MAETVSPNALKMALVETLNGNRDHFREVVAEALEDVALGEAIKEGERTEPVSRERIFEILEEGR